MPKITKDNIKEAVLRFFISGNIPFNQAENPYFQQIVEWIHIEDGKPVSVSRKTVRSHLKEQAKVAIVDLKATLNDIDSKISLALDCWSSRGLYSFMGMFS
jgi:hypothetical protein